MATGLARPGVEVLQEFRTQSPTIIAPTLPPVIVGVAKQVIEVLADDGSGGQMLSAEALVTLPAFFIATAATGSPAVYAGLNTKKLVFSVNNGPAITVTFADVAVAGLTPATVVAQVLSAFATAGVTSVTAELVGTTQWQLRTIGNGEFQFIYIDPTTDAATVAAFGIGLGRTYVGLGDYNQYQVDLPPAAMPDPRGNIAELSVELDTIRAFAAVGGTTLTEFTRDQSFLQAGSVAVGAYLTGSTDISGWTFPTDVAGKTLTVKVGSVTLPLYTILNTAASDNAVKFAAELSAALVSSGVTASITSAKYLTLTSVAGGTTSYIQAVSGTLLTDAVKNVGITPLASASNGISIASIDDGNGDAVTTILEFVGHDFTGAPGQAAITGSDDITAVTNGDALIISDGQQEQTVVFQSATLIADIVSQVNAVVGGSAGGRILASASGSKLVLTHLDKGSDSYIKIVGGTALAHLDPGGTPTIFAGATAVGAPFVPLPGDALYVDGVFYANVSMVAPGAVVSRLKIDTQVPITTHVGTYYHIVAKNLVAGGTATRPYPDLQVDLNGNVKLKHSFLRDTTGTVIDVRAAVYVMYNAVRKDVSSLAADPGLLRFDDTVTLEASLSPISTDNPLALGLFFALLNAPGSQVSGLGVDATTDSEPFGTLEAFTRAAEYLESYELYTIVPLTHDKSVAEVFKTHVDFMSEPENKGERIVLWNPEMPTRALDTLVTTGTNGDALTATSFATKVASLSTMVQNAGVTPTGTIVATDGLFLELDGVNYSISAVSGANVTIRTSFSAGENDDGFYSAVSMTLPIISSDFAIKVRGDELLTLIGQMDKSAVADNMAALATSYSDRRFWVTFPDQCAATLNGTEQVLNGFYLNAGIAGAIAQQPPQQSFTNFPMAGYTRVLRSNNFFTESQLNTMAGGGVYIMVQDVVGGAVTARMALTSNMTSVEQRTDSITKVVDFTAKFLRKSLRTYIGRFNITQGFLDSLGSVVQGLLTFLVESGVLIGANLNNIIQDENNPDSVLVDIRLDVPYPCNYLRLSLVI